MRFIFTRGRTTSVPALGLGLGLGLGACEVGPPAADPIAGAPAALHEQVDGVAVVRNAGPAEILRIHGRAPTDAERLFRADALDASGGDRQTAAGPEREFAVRSIREFSLAPISPGDPLIEVDGAPGFGAVRLAESAFLGQLINAGWIAAADDGGVVFASAVRREVQRYDADGRLLWRSERGDGEDEDIALVVEAGRLRARFRELQHGIAIGPDRRIYLLAEATADSVSIVVLDRDGEWLRSGRVERGTDVYTDARGRIYTAAPAVDAADRVAFPAFDLPSLDGNARVTLADHVGKAVIVNVWASWCLPCRDEMPALDAFARTLDPARVVVLGLNEDENPADARRFVRELGGVGYALAEGRGTLKERIGYRGLPYTVVLDREHRVVRAIHGFGDSIEPIRAALEDALAPEHAPLAEAAR